MEGDQSKFTKLSVPQLKDELRSRGASTRGRKADLIERLKAYEKNKNFANDPIIIPEPLAVNWPSHGFQQLQPQHKDSLPQICLEQIDLYFVHRLAGDKQSTGDIKAIEKGRLVLESDRILATSILREDASNMLYFSGIVGAAMKTRVTYNFKLRMERNSGDILNSHCECPAGRGPHGTCKHLAAVLLMLYNFKEGRGLSIQLSCTENLQTFHKPKYTYSGSPVKAEDLPRKRKLNDDYFDDPRPEIYRNNPNFPDRVRNLIINYCSKTSENLTYRYLIPKADIQTAAIDHMYLDKPFTEYWVEQAVQVSEYKVNAIEEKTRGQSASRTWFNERSWRITASRFGDICLATERRDKFKLCCSLYQPSAATFRSEALIHGKTYESRAIKSFEQKTGLEVYKCGLFVLKDKPYLGASPDGLVGDDAVIEVKCPYTGRNETIAPGKNFKYLICDPVSGEFKLKFNSKYYYQVQGQMYISRRKMCYFVIYTFQDLFIQKIDIDKDYCENSLLPKLELFYCSHFRPYLASLL